MEKLNISMESESPEESMIYQVNVQMKYNHGT